MAKRTTGYWLGYVGLAAGLVLLNLLLFIYTRDANFLRYVLMQITMAWTISATAGGFGSLYEFMWPSSPLLEQSSWVLATGANMWFSYLFISHFVELPKIMPKLDTVAKWSVAGVAIALSARAIPVILERYELGPAVRAITLAGNIVFTGFFVLVFGAIVKLALANHRPAKAVAVAFFPLVLGGVWSIITLVQGAPKASSIMLWASTFELILMSVALADRFNQERLGHEKLARLRRFFSPAVADKLLSDGADDFLKPRRREVVVVFVDLRGYTDYTETHSANDLMRMLDEFHAAMGQIIMAHGGTLERFAGDGMMIFFNDPIEVPDPAGDAVRMALAMQQRFAELDALWQTRGDNLAMGIGIAQGVATLGAIGFEGRRDYGAIGGVTNLAARLCAEAKGGQILLSELVARSCPQARPAGEVRLKGFAQAQAVFDVAA